MKLCAVQARPVKGDIYRNINNHKKLLNLATANGAETIIFPELSLTGYEPDLARELATHAGDSRFNDFQMFSDEQGVTIGVGMPTKKDEGTCISMIFFQPKTERQTYSKKFIHFDEEEIFIPGKNSLVTLSGHPETALAICYEISVHEHAEKAFSSGATIYLASVAKTAEGTEKAITRLAAIAKDYSMTVLMSNCVGLSGGYECAGRSSAWNDQGELVGQLNETDEGILIFDTDTGEKIERII
jgi:predicted amidohydrolase